MFKRVAVIGMGLMGGSLSLALRAKGLAEAVVGIDPNPDALIQAHVIGAITAGATSLAEGVHEADAVFIATPVSLIPEILEGISGVVSDGALISDLGSAKSRITDAGARVFGDRFVAGHPMAGATNNGIVSARGDLFDGAAWAIVRQSAFSIEDDEWAQRLAKLIVALGAKPIALDAARHDAIVALVSHVPHLLAYAFAETVNADAHSPSARAMAGGSYRDQIRVAGSDPGLWSDILMENREAVLETLSTYQTALESLREALASGDKCALARALSSAQGSAIDPMGLE